MLTIGSLFTGIGGIEIGLERTGRFKTIWQSEINEYCCAHLEEKFPNIPNLGDITKVDWNEVERPDVICGGFPCQDISVAGKGAGIKEGTRSGLWSHYAKAIRILRPKYALIENVSAIINNGLNIVLSDLASIGYDAQWKIISAREVGAPHLRKRVFIIAYAERSRPRGGSKERIGQTQNNAEIQRRNTPCIFNPDTTSQRRGTGSSNGQGGQVLPTQEWEVAQEEQTRDRRFLWSDERTETESADSTKLRLERERTEQQTTGVAGKTTTPNLESQQNKRNNVRGIWKKDTRSPWEEFNSADNGNERIQRFGNGQIQKFPEFSWCENVRRIEDLRNRPDIPEPLIRRTRNGFPKGLDSYIWRERIKALGNAVVPACAEKTAREMILTYEDDELSRRRDAACSAEQSHSQPTVERKEE